MGEIDYANEPPQSRVEYLLSQGGAGGSSALAEDVAVLKAAVQRLDGGTSVEGSVRKLIEDAIADVVDGAPSAFDTLKELSDWIGTHGTDYNALLATVNRLDGNIATEGSVKKQVKDAVDDAVADLVDGAPAAYDTLKEISDWIAENGPVIQKLDGNASTTGSVRKLIADAIAELVDGAPTTADTLNEINDKIDSVQNSAQWTKYTPD